MPIDRNALDSTKRLAENAWQRASLQEAALIHKQEFISRNAFLQKIDCCSIITRGSSYITSVKQGRDS